MATPAKKRRTASSRPRKLSASDRDAFKAALMKMRDVIAAQIEGLKNDAVDAGDSANREEDGTDEFAREMALNLASSKSDALIAVEQALRRIEEGTYG